MVNALARSAESGKIDGSTASDSGIMTAAPRPRAARAAISAPALAEYAHHNDAPPKITSPASSRRLRLARSPSAPAGSSTAASTSVYAPENHCNCDVDACRSLASVGSATTGICHQIVRDA
jgi:hypothetical protein